MNELIQWLHKTIEQEASLISLATTNTDKLEHLCKKYAFDLTLEYALKKEIEKTKKKLRKS